MIPERTEETLETTVEMEERTEESAEGPVESNGGTKEQAEAQVTILHSSLQKKDQVMF